MKDRVFIDTNIFVYAAIQNTVNQQKREKAINLIQLTDNEIIISTQVINEFYTILLKNGIADADIQERLLEIIDNTQVENVSMKTIKSSWKIKEKYKYSYWDSLITASDLESNCSILYTEDMQDRQIIDGRLKIINPF